MPLADAHCHYHHPPVATFWDQITADLKEVDLVQAVVNGTSPGDWQAVARFAAGHEWVVPAFGVHPRMVDRADVTGDWRQRLSDQLDRWPGAVIGEVGLDFGRGQPPAGRQEAIFLGQLDEAVRRDRPLCIHGVGAWRRVCDLLAEHGSPGRGFLCHAFTGSVALAERLLDLGARFSFNARTLGRAAVGEVAAMLPPDRILLESDAPYMPPSPKAARYRFDLPRDRGGQRRGHPANLGVACETAAALRGVAPEALAGQTTENTRALFAPASPER